LQSKTVPGEPGKQDFSRFDVEWNTLRGLNAAALVGHLAGNVRKAATRETRLLSSPLELKRLCLGRQFFRSGPVRR